VLPIGQNNLAGFFNFSSATFDFNFHNTSLKLERGDGPKLPYLSALYCGLIHPWIYSAIVFKCFEISVHSNPIP
jgi:hypothetical protein